MQEINGGSYGRPLPTEDEIENKLSKQVEDEPVKKEAEHKHTKSSKHQKSAQSLNEVEPHHDDTEP